MQQRYDEPVIGRFYSNDPVGFSADSPMSSNRYLYVDNNPHKFTDPNGEEKWSFNVSAEAALGGGVKAGVGVSYDTETMQVGVSGLRYPHKSGK